MLGYSVIVLLLLLVLLSLWPLLLVVTIAPALHCSSRLRHDTCSMFCEILTCCDADDEEDELGLFRC